MLPNCNKWKERMVYFFRLASGGCLGKGLALLILNEVFVEMSPENCDHG